MGSEDQRKVQQQPPPGDSCTLGLVLGWGWVLSVLFLVRVQIVRGGEGVMATFPLSVCTLQVLGIYVYQSIVEIVERCHSCLHSPCLEEWPLQFL